MKNTIKELVVYSFQKKLHFSIGILLMIVAVGADLAGPLIIQRIIDDVIAPSNQTLLAVDLLIRYLAVFLGLALVTAITRYFSFLLLTIGANEIVKNMRNDLFAHVQKLPIRYFDNLPAGKVVSRITNDTEQLRIFYVVVVGQVLTNLIYLVGIYIALMQISITFGLITLLLVPFFVLWAVVYQKFAVPFTTKIRSLVSEINGTLNESIQGMSIIQAYQQEDKMEKEFTDVNEEWYKYSLKFTLLDSMGSFSFVEVIKNITLLLLVVYFGNAYFSSALGITVGVLYVYVDYTTRLFNPIQGIVTQYAYLQTAMASAKRVFEMKLVKTEEDQTDELDFKEGEVVFDQVSFAYKDEEYVLKDIDFTARKGQTVALVGHTGSGKSSIMNLLFRFYDPTKGTITIDGTPTTSVSRKSLRRHMGIVLQDPYLFKGTIASNVTLGETSISREAVIKAIEEVGGDTLLHNMPMGIDEPVVDKGSTLSSGQRQLISFARALAFDPEILILDEATSSIDTETEEMIQHAMDVLKKGRTTFIIAHRLSTIQHADQILVLNQGQIVEQGDHESLIQKQGIYAEMYRSQKEKSQ
ncbi:ABC transporter ATP-binding protein [Desemzia sp. FAM 23989]|uniref:ABC transporter ATP-binding protein n=1 Tax=Desemzia sp. FAM 23989 TaxID=3259523 RepID=UPI003888AEC7